MDIYPLFFIIECFICLLSIIVYSGTIWMIYRKPALFKGSFFKLYKANFYFNMVTFVNSFITMRIPQNTCRNCTLAYLFEGHSVRSYSIFPLGLFYSITFNMAYVQYGMMFLVTLNRLTMFLFVLSNDEVWNKMYIYIFIFLIVSPFCETYELITNRTFYKYHPDIDGYKSASEANVENMVHHLTMYMSIVMVLCLAINIMSIITMNNKTIQTGDKKLFYMTFLLFIIQLIPLIDTLSIKLALESETYSSWGKWAKLLLPYVSDIMSLSHPWFLLAFSPPSRREFSKMIFSKNSRINCVFVLNRHLDEIPRSKSDRRAVIP